MARLEFYWIGGMMNNLELIRAYIKNVKSQLDKRLFKTPSPTIEEECRFLCITLG